MFRKIKFYKNLLAEIIETLCSICLYLENDGRYTHNEQARHMRSHFNTLKSFSNEIRREEGQSEVYKF